APEHPFDGGLVERRLSVVILEGMDPADRLAGLHSFPEFDEHLQKAGVARDDEAVRLGRMKGAGRFTGADLTLRKHPEVAEEIAHTLLSDPQGSGRRRARAAQLRGDKDLSQSFDGSV